MSPNTLTNFLQIQCRQYPDWLHRVRVQQIKLTGTQEVVQNGGLCPVHNEHIPPHHHSIYEPMSQEGGIYHESFTKNPHHLGHVRLSLLLRFLLYLHLRVLVQIAIHTTWGFWKSYPINTTISLLKYSPIPNCEFGSIAYWRWEDGISNYLLDSPWSWIFSSNSFPASNSSTLWTSQTFPLPDLSPPSFNFCISGCRH